jgi:hypothetical protein
LRPGGEQVQAAIFDGCHKLGNLPGPARELNLGADELPSTPPSFRKGCNRAEAYAMLVAQLSKARQQVGVEQANAVTLNEPLRPGGQFGGIERSHRLVASQRRSCLLKPWANLFDPALLVG